MSQGLLHFPLCLPLSLLSSGLVEPVIGNVIRPKESSATNWCFSLELSCGRLLSTSGDRESGVKAEALPAFLPASGSFSRAQNRQDLLTKLGDLEDSMGLRRGRHAASSCVSPPLA